MACLQLLKSSSSNSHAKFRCFCSEFNSKVSAKRSLRLQNSGIMLDYRRFRVSCKVEESYSQSNGEEPPESLFMKELRRRGMTPTSLLEGENRSINRDDEIELREEDSGWSYSRRNGVTIDAERNIFNQRETSMALNSEGLEYFGPEFVHDGSKTLVAPPQYIDPYALLEEERIYKIAPLLN